MGIEIIGKLTQKNNGDFKLVDLADVDYDGTGKSAKQELENKIEEAKNSSTPYDDTEIKADINNIKTDLGTEELTTTSKKLKGAINELGSQIKDIVINVKDFGAKGDGVTDDTPFVRKAIEYATANNILNVKFPLGKYYIIGLNVTSSINLIFEDATLIRPLDTYAFLFDYHSDIKYNISQIGVSDDGIKQKISIEDTSNFKRGDIVKIYSDDLIPNVRYNSKNGEFKVVYDVKEGYLLLSGLLRNSYTTNPGIVKLTDKTVNIEGATISAINNNLGEITLPAIQIVGGKYHNLDSIKIIDVSDTAIKMIGCYGYTAYVSSKYQANGETYNEDILKIGYGLIDIAGNGYRVRFNSNNCRHPFDTNQSTTLTDTYAEAHGVSENGFIVDSLSMGGSYAGISTHEDCYNINFNNINVIDGVRYGATLRGESSIIQNCFIDCYDGITAGNYAGTAANKTSNIGNHIIRNTKIKAKNMAISLNGFGTKAKISFYDCVIEGKISITDYDCEFYNCKLDMKDTTLSNSTVTFNNCIINKSGGFGTLNSTVYFNSCKIYALDTDLLHPNDGITNIEFNNCIVNWSKCTTTSRNAIFGMYTAKANAEININGLNSVFISNRETNNLYIGYISGAPKSCNVTLFNTFVYPFENLVFKKEPWNDYITIKNITYASGSKELS